MGSYEHIWVLGDKFVEDSFLECVTTNSSAQMPMGSKDFYMKNHFGLSSHVASGPGNFIARMSNAFKNAIQEKKLLPKYILVTLDADFYTDLNVKNFGLTQMMDRELTWLAKQFFRMSLTYKENLPEKVKKQSHPKFLWVMAPAHKFFEDNEQRRKFNNCLEEACKDYYNMHVLQLKNYWSFDKDGLVARSGNSAGYRITSLGLKTYWSAIDSAVQYRDTSVSQNSMHRKGKNNIKKHLFFGPKENKFAGNNKEAKFISFADNKFKKPYQLDNNTFPSQFQRWH